MSHLRIDFLGPYLVCKGAINRPMETLQLPNSELLMARSLPGTPTVLLTFENGKSCTWHDCGASTAYMQAKDTLSKSEFEHFAKMEASFSVMASGPVAHRLYPTVAAIHPLGHVDCRMPDVKAHMHTARQLTLAVKARRAAIDSLRIKPQPARRKLATV